MLKLKLSVLTFLSAFSLLVFANPTLAGGGPVEFTVNPNTSLNHWIKSIFPFFR